MTLKFWEKLNTAPVSIFHWKNLRPGSFEWSCGSITIILPIYNHVMNLVIFFLPLDLNFSEMLNTAPNKSFWFTKVPLWYISIELWLQNCFLIHIWSCGDLDPWLLVLKFSEMLNIAPISLPDWQKFLPGYGSKTDFLPIFVYCHVIVHISNQLQWWIFI